MIILFLIKLLFFNFIYSLFIGSVLYIVMIVLSSFFKLNFDKPHRLLSFFGIVIGSFFIAFQPLVFVESVDMISENHKISTFLWFLCAWILCTPIAVIKSENLRDKLFGIFVSNISFIIALFSNIEDVFLVKHIAIYVIV